MTLLDFCRNHGHLFIYGAGKRGKSIKNMIEQNGFKIEAYIVSNLGDNPRKIESTDVLTLNKWEKSYSKMDVGIVIAVADKYIDEITYSLVSADIESYFYASNEACQEFKRAVDPVSSHDLLGSVEPVSRLFGFDRGTPIDRYYIEKFLNESSANMPNPQNTFEVGESIYSQKLRLPP